jgi:hypothetical protein
MDAMNADASAVVVASPRRGFGDTDGVVLRDKSVIIASLLVFADTIGKSLHLTDILDRSILAISIGEISVPSTRKA